MSSNVKMILIIIAVAAVAAGGYFAFVKEKEPKDHFEEAADELKSGVNKILEK